MVGGGENRNKSSHTEAPRRLMARTRKLYFVAGSMCVCASKDWFRPLNTVASGPSTHQSSCAG